MFYFYKFNQLLYLLFKGMCCIMTDLCVLLIVAVNNLPETIHIKYMPGKPEIFLLKENLNNR